ncbi:hypothetical protein EW145_g4687 [Phellinidium pouzarii]|uniref:Uncharacterized protein n=1 Tax=Phellinidium pouzarii TaxID=167371 RepID=A0A4S4L2M4_9AGAM|nr:hypothetical protein EW145_g4687 [Phellinidium pouzarii]
MSTSQRKSVSSSSPSTSVELPPKRRGKALRPVSKPLANTRLTNLIYILLGFGVLLSAFYAYRIMQWKSEVGGWWNLALGKQPPQAQVPPQAGGRMYGGTRSGGARSSKKNMELEDHISGLASILGMQPSDLAGALAGAISEHVAPKTISSLSSSVSSSASAAGAGSTAADALFQSSDENLGTDGGSRGDSGTGEGMMSGAEAVARAVEALVGSDEPIEAD